MIAVGSIFTGIGLFDLGILWAIAALGLDAEVVYQVEIDPFCRACLAQNFPNVPRFTDVVKVQAHDLRSADVLVCSPPCQDISVAGAGAGVDGARSGLWREVIRIAEAKRPRVICFENVAALVSRGLDLVVRELERIGYNVEAAIVRASDVGAPHRRERVFLFARLADAARGGRTKGSRNGAAPRTSRSRRAARAGDSAELADTVRAGCEGRVSERDQRRVEPAERGGERGDGQAVADRERLEGLPSPLGTDGGLDIERGDHASRCGEGMADADRDALRDAEQRRPGRRPRTVRDGGHAVARHDRESGGRDVEPRLGRNPHGLPAFFLRWPARPGDAPFVWEPPRAVTAYSPTRNERLRALGNAIVPQLVAVKFAPLLAEVFA